MIEITNTEVFGWEAAIRGMRNPMNSWDKSDSIIDNNGLYELGENDLKLMKTLANAGTDHSKFLRMITVTCDIVAPIYWVQEHDTYKVGTVRNSCSFMHKGISKPFEITDFSIEDKRIYSLLTPRVPKKYPLIYKYDTEEYKVYTTESGKKYKVFKNGRIFREEFTTDESSGRKRTFKEREVNPSVNPSGYYEINIGGRNGEKWLLHRLVAHCWIENSENLETVNHKDGNKGNNCADNLEWMSRKDNIIDAFEKGLYSNNLKTAYAAWKRMHTAIEPYEKIRLKKDYNLGMSISQISEKYGISYIKANNIVCGKTTENINLFLNCLAWERNIETLNALREEYLDTKNDEVFKAIRQLLPMGYNVRYTWQANYQVLRNIRNSDRRNHKLDEWRITFMDWIDSLPYAEELLKKSEL